MIFFKEIPLPPQGQVFLRIPATMMDAMKARGCKEFRVVIRKDGSILIKPVTPEAPPIFLDITSIV